MNLYWSVYRNLEKELVELSNQIHFDDHQLTVYSVKIAELLIRCSVEIESIAKDLFLDNGGEKTDEGDLYFDTHCINFLENKWLLSKKQVIISAQNFYFKEEENKVLTPLKKANKRGTSGSDWKKAYQAVKHNRTYSLSQGNLKNLIRALAALYLLNIYYKSDGFDLQDDHAALAFDERLGSEIFSIKLHVNTIFSLNNKYDKKEDFDECVYLSKITDKTLKKMRETSKKAQKKGEDAMAKYSKGIIKEIEAAEKDKKISIFFLEALKAERSVFEKLQFEAIINKNQVFS